MILFFTELTDLHPLHTRGQVKTSLRAARMHLKLQKASTINVVYPLPWLLSDLQCAEEASQGAPTLAEWIDFYIDALALAEENPSRVKLTPLDVQLNLSDTIPLGDSLEAYLLEQTYPEALDLLENLELHAELDGKRAAQTRNPTGLMPQAVAEQVALLVKQQKKSTATLEELQANYKRLEKEHAALKATPPVPAAPSYPDLREQCKSVEEENKLLLEQLFTVQEELEKLFLSGKELEKKQQEERRKLEQEIAELKAKPPAPTAPSYPDLREKTKDLEAENELLLSQLHLVQEELERHYLELKCFKKESQHSSAALQQVHEFLRKQMGGQPV